MLVFGVYVYSKKWDSDCMISKFGHHHPPYLRACIVGKLSFLFKGLFLQRCRKVYEIHAKWRWNLSPGFWNRSLWHGTKMFFTWKVPPTRWFKPWPFHPLIGGHQQPLNRVTFSPSKLLHLKTLMRGTPRIEKIRFPLSFRAAEKTMMSMDCCWAAFYGKTRSLKEGPKRFLGVKFECCLQVWYTCKYISKSIISDIQYLRSNIY